MSLHTWKRLTKKSVDVDYYKQAVVITRLFAFVGPKYLVNSTNYRLLLRLLVICKPSGFLDRFLIFGWCDLSRHPPCGWSELVWLKFWRLVGADHVYVIDLKSN